MVGLAAALWDSFVCSILSDGLIYDYLDEVRSPVVFLCFSVILQLGSEEQSSAFAAL